MDNNSSTSNITNKNTVTEILNIVTQIKQQMQQPYFATRHNSGGMFFNNHSSSSPIHKFNSMVTNEDRSSSTHDLSKELIHKLDNYLITKQELTSDNNLSKEEQRFNALATIIGTNEATLCANVLPENSITPVHKLPGVKL